MNLPTGTAREEGLLLKNFNLVSKLNELSDVVFTGYIVATIEGFDGLEEALIFLKKGEIIGAIYDYLKYSKQFFGDKALPMIFNGFGASNAIIDIYFLSTQQMDLITAFNEKILLNKSISKKEFTSIKVNAFDSKYALEALQDALEKKNESKYSVLKRLGLSKIS